MGLIPPWMAALGMTSSSLLVVFNALRLKDKGNEQRLSETSSRSSSTNPQQEAKA